MNVKELAKGLTYKGEAEGKRQTYHVFEGKGFYFIVSFHKGDADSGNFHFVEPGAVEYVRKNFAGESGVTAKAVFEKGHRTHYFARELDALGVLYVLVGIGDCAVDKRFKDKLLHFNMKPS